MNVEHKIGVAQRGFREGGRAQSPLRAAKAAFANARNPAQGAASRKLTSGSPSAHSVARTPAQ
eukprot:1882913-Alexandrium_andersonii.AAC.1